MTLNRVAVIGASLAGLRAAEALRHGGFSGHLTLVGAEVHYPPYDRPPLSKEVLSGAWQPEQARVPMRADVDAELLLGERAVALHLGARNVTLASGIRLPFDGLVIATGASPRYPAIVKQGLEGVAVLRTVDDCFALQRELDKGPKVVVIGAGFIGCEVASVCRQRGLDVTVVEALPWPLGGSFGPEVGQVLTAVHEDHGVKLRLRTTVIAIEGSRRVERVLLSDGSALPADVLVVATGAAPETGWLEQSGLTLDRGVLLDSSCKAVGAQNVVAAGDVARWHNPLFDQAMRVEHWSNATEQAILAAESLLSEGGQAPEFRSVPYFWSDQHQNRIQFVGIPGDSTIIREGTLDDRRFVVLYGRRGIIVGALCMNWPARVPHYRRLIAAKAAYPPRMSTIGPRSV